MWDWFKCQPRWLRHALARLEQKVDTLMSSFDDLKAAQAVTDTKIAAVQTDVQTLLAKLAAIPTGGLTPEQQAALDDAVTHANSINDSLGAIDASANAPPTTT